LVVDVGPPAGQIAEAIIRMLGSSAVMDVKSNGVQR
jgi:hypothetical protein